MTVNEPLFESAHGALVFAFNYSGQQYDRPIMNRLPDGPIDYVSKGLSGMDGAAQAAMVFNKLFYLPDLYQYLVFATYAPRTLPCHCRRSCCAGNKRNEQWHACIHMIEQAAITQALSGCVSIRSLRRGIVQRAFGDKSVTLAELADRAEVSETTANSHNQKVRQWLFGVPGRKDKEAVEGVKHAAVRMIGTILVADGLAGY